VYTTNLEGKLKEYIKHLCKARDNIEKREDDKISNACFPRSIPISTLSPTAEAITLEVVIRDLEKIVYLKDFSYWDC